MADGMLPAFEIRNLRSSNDSNQANALVRVSAPNYNRTIATAPAAKLKYKDEENDTIVLGSSRELADRLAEPVQQPRSSRSRRDPMAIAMLLSEAETNPEKLKHHTFDIDEREEIQKLWREIQRGKKSPPPVPEHAKSTSSKEPSADNAPLAGNVKSINPDPDMKRTSTTLHAHGPPDWKSMPPTLETICLKKEMVAVAYGKFRRDMWKPIAGEVGISWKEAETLYSTMNMRTMIAKAESYAAHQESVEDIKSVLSTDGEWHENRQQQNFGSSQLPAAVGLEEYRSHYFNATMPPQPRTDRLANKFAKPDSTNTTTGVSFGPITDTTPGANLTAEGKRQAQAAGDILRARSTPSRHRKTPMSTFDHNTYSNRWADYKASEATFPVKPAKDVPQGFKKPILTSEGKRQAQAAGDKLRCRTNPIRHSRPSRSGSLENGVNKNRWSSYVAPRIARFDDHLRTEAKPETKSSPEAAETNNPDKQPTLLEVFEAELAKDASNADETTARTDFPDPDVSAIPDSAARSKASSDNLRTNTTSNQNSPSSQQGPFMLDGIQTINDHLQSLTGDMEPPQGLSRVFENGLRTAALGFDALIQGLGGGSQTQAAADRASEVENQGIDQAIKGLKDIVAIFSTGVGSSPAGEKHDDQPLSTASGAEKLAENSSDKDASGPKANNATSNGPVSTNSDAAQQHERLPQRRTPEREHLMRCPQRYNGTGHGLRYHKPGPIHLPQHSKLPRPASVAAAQSPSNGLGYVDHLRQRQSTGITNAPNESPMTSPPPAATRFPTLAQFEKGQDLKLSPGFPALPSMEPLVPQRVIHSPSIAPIRAEALEAAMETTLSPLQRRLKQIHEQSSTDKHEEHRNESNSVISKEDAQRPSSKVDGQSAMRAHKDPETQYRLAKELNDLRLRDFRQEAAGAQKRESSNQAFQDYQMQMMLLEQPNKKSNHALQDYQMQLMLLEQQEKKRKMMARASGAILPEDDTENSPARTKEEIQDQQMQAMVREQMNKKALLMARQEQDVAGVVRPKDHSDDRDLSAQRNYRPSSAARLAAPFDPLEVERSAPPDLASGIRRNATVAGTNNRHNLPRRRPYSEAYDGFGRLPWDSFLGDSHSESHGSVWHPETDLAKRRSHARDQASRQQKMQDHLTRHATVNSATHAPKLSRYGNSGRRGAIVAGPIERCVEQLKDLGFGDDGDRERLVVYAQAAKGDLVEAIDMIDEEQRVYRDFS